MRVEEPLGRGMKPGELLRSPFPHLRNWRRLCQLDRMYVPLEVISNPLRSRMAISQAFAPETSANDGRAYALVVKAPINSTVRFIRVSPERSSVSHVPL